MKSRGLSQALLGISIALSLLVLISIVMQFGDVYMTSQLRSNTPPTVLAALDAQGLPAGDASQVAADSALNGGPVMLKASIGNFISLLPALILAMVYVYDRKAARSRVGQISAVLVITTILASLGFFNLMG